MKAKKEDLQYIGLLVDDKSSCIITVIIQDKVTVTINFISKVKSIHKKQKCIIQW